MGPKLYQSEPEITTRDPTFKLKMELRHVKFVQAPSINQQGRATLLKSTVRLLREHLVVTSILCARECFSK